MNEVSHYLKLLSDPKVNKVMLSVSMLQELSYDELCSLKNRTPGIFRSIVTARYLYRKDFGRVAKGSANFSLGKDTAEYFGTLAYIFEQNKEQINSFVQLRDCFEKYLLHGRYQDCFLTLDRINDISFSLWGADISIKLKHLANGLPSATNEYNSLYKSNDKLRSFCFYSYKTSDVDVPFESDVRHYLKSFSNNVDARDFVISHCFPFIKIDEGSWMKTSGIFSIIDLYQTFILSLRSLSKETIRDERFKRYLSIINSKVDDPIIHKFSWLFLGNSIVWDDATRDNIIASYVYGEYSSVIKYAEAYLKHYPNDIPILELYIKSIIQTGESIKEVDNEACLYDRLSFYYYRYLLNDESSNLFLSKLMNISQVWSSFSSFLHISRTCEIKEENDIANEYSDYWRTSYAANIFDILLYSSYAERELLLRRWNDTLVVILDKYNNSPSIIDKSDFVDIQFNEQKLVIDELSNLTANRQVPVYSRNKICSFIFNQYLKSKRYQVATSFFSDEMLSNDHLSLTLLDQQLVNELQDNDVEKNCNNPLDFSIFYTFLNFAPYKRYLSYKRFLKQRGVDKASMLCVDGSERIHYFLESVADRKVIGLHVRMFKNSLEVIEERIAIVKKLYDFYQDKKYADEVNTLVQEQTISELVQQVDNSKIYVDTESIKNFELKNQSVLFDLMKSTDGDLQYFEDQSPYLIQLLSLLQNVSSSVCLIDSKGKYISTNYRYSLFEKLYLEVRNQFVSNPKYGLDYYLSTRIRHGTIDNQLRNHFQEYHLITNIDDAGNYAINSFWINKFGLTGSAYQECVQCFQSFSQRIDDVILKLKSEKIQIKTEEETDKINAVFDFSANRLDELLNDIFVSCAQGTYDDCITKVFDKLWVNTENCLEKMRDELTKTHDEMRETLNGLHTVVFAIVPDNQSRKAFGDAITSCSTCLQTDFDIVKGWFQRKNTLVFDFTLQQVFEASLSAINRINQGALVLSTSINSPSAYMGEYFGAFHDLFHDLLNNVLDYEKKGHIEKGHGQAEIFERKNILHIIVRNPLADSDVQGIERILEDQEGKYSSLLKKGQSRMEGKSGFTKIYNIVNNIFQADGNMYQNRIEKNYFVANIQIDTVNLKKI